MDRNHLANTKIYILCECFFHIVLMQAGEITLLMADTILVTQYDIQETVSKVYAISTQVPNIRTESIRIGHLFNRIITLLWDCFMVCGLKAFIVSSFRCWHFEVDFRLIAGFQTIQFLLKILILTAFQQSLSSDSWM